MFFMRILMLLSLFGWEITANCSGAKLKPCFAYQTCFRTSKRISVEFFLVIFFRQSRDLLSYPSLFCCLSISKQTCPDFALLQIPPPDLSTRPHDKILDCKRFSCCFNSVNLCISSLMVPRTVTWINGGSMIASVSENISVLISFWLPYDLKPRKPWYKQYSCPISGSVGKSLHRLFVFLLTFTSCWIQDTPL